MTQAANLLVQYGRSPTAFTFSLLSPSSGDRTSCMWRGNQAVRLGEAISAAPLSPVGAQHYPLLECKSRFNKMKTARYVDWKMTVPVLARPSSTSTSYTVIGTRIQTWSVLVPLNVDTSTIGDIASLEASVMQSSLAVTVNSDGFSPS